MINDIDTKLLEQIADLTGQPVGAFNIRAKSSANRAMRLLQRSQITSTRTYFCTTP